MVWSLLETNLRELKIVFVMNQLRVPGVHVRVCICPDAHIQSNARFHAPERRDLFVYAFENHGIFGPYLANFTDVRFKSTEAINLMSKKEKGFHSFGK
jgi:hypothetical protein